MGKDTLSASESGIEEIRKRLKLNGKSQTELALDVYCSRETLSSLLRGNNIKEDTFKAVCEKLQLNWRDIVDEKHLKNFKPNEIAALVTKLRKHVEPDIENRCGTMRIFDMTQPIGLGEIYTQVNILEKILSQRRKEITDLMAICNLAEFSRFNFGAVKEEKILAISCVF